MCRASHAQVCHISSPLRQNLRVCRGHMRMSADNRGHAAVHPKTHGALFRGGVSVKIQNLYFGSASNLTKNLVDFIKWASKRHLVNLFFHEYFAHEISDQDRLAFDFDNLVAVSYKLGREIGRPYQPISKLGKHLFIFWLVIDMVAAGEKVYSCFCQIPHRSKSNPLAMSQVFNVSDHKIWRVFSFEHGQDFGNCLAAGLAHDVAEKKDFHIYLAYSTTRISLMTCTLISPGYLSCCSILFAISRANFIAAQSSILFGSTKTLISRPA